MGDRYDVLNRRWVMGLAHSPNGVIHITPEDGPDQPVILACWRPAVAAHIVALHNALLATRMTSSTTREEA